jgi:hypothetical protein
VRHNWIAVALAYGCGCGRAPAPATPHAVALAEPRPLPTVQAPAPPPPPPRRRREAVVGPSDVWLSVSFVEARKHPEATRVDAVIRGTPAWRAFPTIDPMRDLDWMEQHGDDMIVAHAVPDARVDGAIAKVAQPSPVGVPRVHAWRGVVNHLDVVFLRAQPHVIRIDRAEYAERDATDLVARPPAAPRFHPGEAIEVRILQPSGVIGGAPDDISEARVWIDARPADAGADLYAVASCPDPDAARADAAAIQELVRRKNSFATRLLTAGLLNHVEVTPVGAEVKLHVRATQQQIEAVLGLAASLYGAHP